jgi:hypothetical protein
VQETNTKPVPIVSFLSLVAIIEFFRPTLHRDIKYLQNVGVNVVDWIGLAQDRYRWRALVDSIMNLRVL